MILILGIIFLALVLAVSGDRGAKSLLTLVANAVALSVLILLINKGAHPALAFFIACIIIVAVILFYQNGINLKTIAAGIAILGVMLVLLPLFHWVQVGAQLQGIPNSAYEITDANGYTRNIGVSMKWLYTGVIFMMLIGALIDSAIAVSTATYEVVRHKRNMGMGEIFVSSMKMGEDILATMTHTLFFIYIAEMLALIIQFVDVYSFSRMINSKEFAQGIFEITTGCIGCTLTIPICGIICAAIYSKIKTIE